MQPFTTPYVQSSRSTVLAGHPGHPGLEIDLRGSDFFEDFTLYPVYHPDALSHSSTEVISLLNDVKRGLGSVICVSVV